MIIRWLFNKSIQMIKIKEVNKMIKMMKRKKKKNEIESNLKQTKNDKWGKTKVILTKSVFILLALKKMLAPTMMLCSDSAHTHTY